MPIGIVEQYTVVIKARSVYYARQEAACHGVNLHDVTALGEEVRASAEVSDPSRLLEWFAEAQGLEEPLPVGTLLLFTQDARHAPRPRKIVS